MDLTPIPTGNDVRVNTFTSDEQLHAAVAALAGGGFVVTWTSSGQDGSSRGIYGQRYLADGTRLGSEFQVNTFIASEQKNPAVAALAGGGFVVTWTSSGQDGSYEGIYGQQYAADGTRLGSEFRVNPYTIGTQRDSSVAALAGGGFVVTWLSYGQEGDGGIYGQRYLADGTALGTEFRVNTHTAYDQIYPSVAGLAGGGFVVTWSSWLQDGDLSGIYGQRYAANGTALGTEFRVNTYTTDDQAYSSMAALAGGGFVVTWSSVNPGLDRWDMYGQRYAADGTALGTEFRVNTYTTSDQSFSSVAAIADGGFVVTWSSYGQDGDRWGIYGQGYLADGTPLGSEFRVNQISAGNQMTHSNYSNFEGSTSGTVATLADGRLVQVWAGNGAEEVFFRLINVPDINVPPVVNDTATTNEDTPINIQVLANDTFEGTPAITGTTNGAHGTVAVNNNGTAGNTADDFVVYTPTPDFNGTDSFTYTVASGGVTETATVSVTLNAVQDVFDDTATVTQNSGANPINVLANDFFEGIEQITAVTQGTSGTVAINDNGTAGNTADDFVAYTANTGFFGNDTFTYTVTSPTGTAETATVSVSVSPDVAPTAVSDSGTVAEDAAAIAIDVLANDTDPDAGPKVIATASDPAHGTLVLTGGLPGAHTGLTYQPNADFNGADTFTYTLNGGSTTIVTVTVTPVADIVNDAVTVNEDFGTNNLDLFANDTFENPGRTITAVGTATHGTTAINNNNTAGDATDDLVTYTQTDADFNGTDTFTYTVTSPAGVTETASVTVTISAVADIVNDNATTNEDTTVSIALLANDTFEGTEAITGTTNGAHGTVAVNNNGTPGNTADDFVVYTPAPDFNGTDAFTYTVTSGGDTETGTVTVAVNPVTDINGDTATTNEDTAVNIPVLANDSFGTPQITGATNGAHGAVTINNNDTPGNSADDFVVFTPAPDFNGTDSFTYTVTSDDLTETASVSVTVTPAADIVNDSLTIAQDSGAHNLDLLANDTFENPGRSITSVGAASHGAVTINNNGTPGNTADDFVVYAPTAGYSGADAFTYTVTSGGVTETGTVSVAVTAAPPPSTTPTSGNDDITGTAGPETIVALAGDDIIDGRGAGDLLFGNQGNDTAFGRTGNDTIWGGQGNDSLDGAQDSDFLWGNEGADTIVGGDGANTIVGGQDSSDAADSITAGSGPDLIWGNGGADTIVADGGNNTLIGGFGADSLLSGAGDDIVFGNESNDTIAAGDGANLIFGGLGDDSILTGSGNDTIFGNENNDTIAGGTGADRYAFLVGSGNDQINGFVFGEGDRLDLQGQTFTQGTSGDGDVLLTLFGGGTVELNGITPAGFSPTFVL